MAKWKDLPPELKHQVFEVILSTRPKASTANYAAVCREWQDFFERRTFRKLVLNYSCLDDFRQNARGREDIIKHIWLRIQPPKWECFFCCNRLEPSEQLTRNNQVFTNAMWTLMDILSSWGDVDVDNGPGLALEISVHAPNRLRHRFDCCVFDKDIYPCDLPETCTMEENCSLSRQVRPCELRGSICRLVREHMGLMEELRAVENVELDFGTMKDGQTAELPTVRCVKELTIRPLNVRRFGYQTVREIAKSFGKPETYNWEPELL
ncbi:uncharacterized protein Triagg1_1723 [Trichoderma aggressivum f. europaeum]|uniref:F-box domain-containing protein n=1 Tax=Trichoderma aggressivum f. europaeum TaxID=173218 RepID=A0AAE1II01_9HYPO|nr:hypothetical protein Triagg1_1723 [Trichoderma aggressivum f. europaeum]